MLLRAFQTQFRKRSLLSVNISRVMYHANERKPKRSQNSRFSRGILQAFHHQLLYEGSCLLFIYITDATVKAASQLTECLKQNSVLVISRRWQEKVALSFRLRPRWHITLTRQSMCLCNHFVDILVRHVEEAKYAVNSIAEKRNGPKISMRRSP
jgi:hypothetical protein